MLAVLYSMLFSLILTHMLFLIVHRQLIKVLMNLVNQYILYTDISMSHGILEI